MFKFKLEFLLRFRRQKEEAAMLELAGRIREAGAKRWELESLIARSEDLAAEVRHRSAEPIPAPVIILYRDYLDHLRRAKKAAQRGLDRAEALVAEKREKLIEASIQRKIIDRYKEIQYEKYKETENRREQKSLDELAALRAKWRVNENQG